jgi:predicted amidohydrolase YtcJ
MEALKSYTILGANAGFQEGVKGSLEAGKWADIVILSKDIMEEEPAEVLETTVEMTIIAGQIVYISGKSH